MSGSDPRPISQPPQETELDLRKLADGGLKVSAETREDPADRAHRHALELALQRHTLEQGAKDASFSRWKDGGRFVLSSLLIAGVGGLATYFVLHGDKDAQGWGRTVLAGLITGVVGYFIGKPKE